MFGDPAILVTADIDHRDGEVFAAGLASHEVAKVAAATSDARPGLVTAGDDLFDGQVQVREGGAQACNRSFQAV